MAKQVQLRRGTTAELSSVTGAAGEVIVDTTKDTLTVHDAYTAGGIPLLREDTTNLADSTIDINKLDSSSASPGEVVKRNASGTALEFGSAGFQSMQVFTSSGTWTKPAGINKIKVYVTGGGAGGSSCGDSSPGGGAGGTAIKVIDVSSVSSVSVTVGNGGARGCGASNGGTSSFGSYCSASGGSAPNNGDTGNGADSEGGGGGIGSGGDINIRGGGGGGAAGSDQVAPGGASYWGSGGAGGEQANQSPGWTGPGAYGGGGGGSNGTFSGTEGYGAQGVVVVEEYA